jgi:transposase
MSLLPQNVGKVPTETARIAQTAFPKGNIYMRMRDKLGVFYTDEQFADVYATRGQPGFSPWRLALVSIMQYAEDLSDRHAANAVRARIDWKYALGLELENAGFDFSILSEFRQRVVAGEMEEELLNTMLKKVQEEGLLKKRGKQRTDSTHVLAVVQNLNRLATIGETMRATLNVLAEVSPEWVKSTVSVEWFDRYSRRIEDTRLPRKKKEREEWVKQVGDDGHQLLEQIYGSKTHDWLWKIPAVQTMRLVWMYQFYQDEGELKLREPKDLPPATIRFDSPYDPEAHYGIKRDTKWVGFKVHVTESCDDDQPHLITHVETTIAPQSDANMTEVIHEALVKKDCLPEIHLVDAGYVDAEQIVNSQEKYGVRLVGPVRPNVSWQAKAQKGYAISDFKVDWEAETVTCPNDKTTTKWKPLVDKWGNSIIRITFPAKACAACEARPLCTKREKTPRSLTIRPQTHHEALQLARQEEKTTVWKKEYNKRAGIEGTISQGVRGFGMRDCRYLGLAKTHLQHVFTAIAINITRLDAWFTGKKRAVTRTSKFATLRPIPA